MSWIGTGSTSAGSERLYRELLEMPGVRPYPSDGNFILVDISKAGRTVAEVVEATRENRASSSEP